MDWNVPLFWKQGQFLQPQHFQLQDMHARTLVEPYRLHMADRKSVV